MAKYVIGCLGVAVLGIIALAIIIGAMWADSYNKLVGGRQGVDAGWAEVENQYQRRADLVGNLVETVKGAANFEKSTLVEVVQARASVGQIKIDPNQAPTDAAQIQKFEQTQGALTGALSRLLVVSERYPDLKANQNFLDLQAQLEGTENRIATARNHFNQAAQNYNTTVQSFPTNFIAGMSGFTTRPYFQAKEGSDAPPSVKFDFNTPTTPAAPAPAK